VSWRRNYAVSATPFAEAGPDPAVSLADLCVECRALMPDESPFVGLYVRQFDTMMIAPPVYLPALIRDFLRAGGAIEVRTLHDRRDVLALPQRVVFNCTGLGAKEIFGDPELTPVKGQLTVLLPQPDVTYNAIGDGIYMFPRQDGILLGGTEQRGDWSLTPDLAAEAHIMAAQRALFAALRA
jgi:glycine/D-amino acid oxidase-like deaminating enzyme